jgi:hypothetical protein
LLAKVSAGDFIRSVEGSGMRECTHVGGIRKSPKRHPVPAGCSFQVEDVGIPEIVSPGMLTRICYCCGEKLDTVSPDNPNICVSCAAWPPEEIPALNRIVELVPIDDDVPAGGKPQLN